MEGRIALIVSDVFVRRLTPALAGFVRRRVDFRIVDIYRPARELMDCVAELSPIGIITESLPRLTDRILDLGLPTVIADTDVAMPGAVSLDVDDHAVGLEAARFFRAAGYRHFACVYNRAPYGVQRREGFRKGVAGVAESLDERLQVERKARYYMESWNEPTGYLRRWLRGLPKPVAVFAVHDPLGRLVAEAALEEGLRVPDEVAVLGANDDELVCVLNHPPLSSVAIPWHRIGELAGEWVLALAGGKKAPDSACLVSPGPVAVRQSTSPLAVDDVDLRRVMEYLRAHYRDPISIGGVCHALRLNRRAVERKFAAHLRETPWQCLTRMRVEAAKALLIDTRISVTMVAEHCGFPDPERFSVIFRRTCGMSPLRFRKQTLQATELGLRRVPDA